MVTLRSATLHARSGSLPTNRMENLNISERRRSLRSHSVSAGSKGRDPDRELGPNNSPEAAHDQAVATLCNHNTLVTDGQAVNTDADKTTSSAPSGISTDGNNDAFSSDEQPAEVQEGPSPTKPKILQLLEFPVEVLQQILIALPTDHDVMNFALVCRAGRNVVSASVWAGRFLEKFDPASGTLEELEYDYKLRLELSRRFISWAQLPGLPIHVMENLLKGMILESNAKAELAMDGSTSIQGKNHKFFFEYFGLRGVNEVQRGCDLLDCVSRVGLYPALPPMLTTRHSLSTLFLEQVVLCHLALHPSINHMQGGYQPSQIIAYACYRHQPILAGRMGDAVNLTFCMNLINYFKYTLKAPNGQGPMASQFLALTYSMMPKPWVGKLKDETITLAKMWKGCYGCVHPGVLVNLRRGILRGDMAVDQVSHFETLECFTEIDEHPKLQFRAEYERLVQSKPRGSYEHLNGEKKMPEVKDFFVLISGPNNLEYYAHGRVYSLPPQQGIPGFQRITMVADYPLHGRGQQFGPGSSSLWSYEGVVLPGGQIMMGRWVDLRSSIIDHNHPFSYCGPFIFWTVDTPGHDIDHAIRFMDSIDPDFIHLD